MWTATLLLSLLFAAEPPLPGSSPPATDPPSVQLPAELARVLTDYEAAWRSRDAAALSRLFAEDGYVLQDGQPPARGRAAIERAYAGAGGPLSLRAFAFATEGAVGYILGGFAREAGAPDAGKFTLTLRKEGGRWLIVSDMDNPNQRRRPPASPAPATPPAPPQPVSGES
jgi:ketosteroid isomerase-like protein